MSFAREKVWTRVYLLVAPFLQIHFTLSICSSIGSNKNWHLVVLHPLAEENVILDINMLCVFYRNLYRQSWKTLFQWKYPSTWISIDDTQLLRGGVRLQSHCFLHSSPPIRIHTLFFSRFACFSSTRGIVFCLPPSSLFPPHFFIMSIFVSFIVIQGQAVKLT